MHKDVQIKGAPKESPSSKASRWIPPGSSRSLCIYVAAHRMLLHTESFYEILSVQNCRRSR